MKNLFTLLIALLFTAGMATAQNSSSVVQTGLGAHHATVTQSGNLNAVGITQAGDAVFTAPDPDIPAPANYAVVSQVGLSNLVGLGQSGVGASASVTQTGNYNRLNGVQDGDSQFPNTLLHLTVLQNGNNNAGDVYQFAHDDNHILIDQDGEWNYANVQQGRNIGLSSITQRGISHEAYIKQYTGLALMSSAVIVQTGDAGTGHFASQDMGEAGGPMDGSNFMRIEQTNGDQNTAYQTMRAKDGMYTASGNEQYIFQAGGGLNVATQFAGPNGAIDTDDNTASIYQDGGYNNSASQSQKGFSNYAFLQQHADADWNISTQLQVGDNLSTTVHQWNDGNNSYVDQLGHGHVAEVTQIGL